MVLDMSTTCVAMGKIQTRSGRARASRPTGPRTTAAIPPPTRRGVSLSPIAGHKGYGLAVMVGQP